MSRNEEWFLCKMSVTSRRYPGTSILSDQNDRGDRVSLTDLSTTLPENF